MRTRLISVFAVPALISAVAAVGCGDSEGDSGSNKSGGNCSIKDDKVVCPDGSSFDLADLQGQDGSDGAQGTDGQNGTPGANGEDGANGDNGTKGDPGDDGEPGGADEAGSRLTRLATVPLGAEVTGAFLTEGGTLFFNVQHPDPSNSTADSAGKVFNIGTVGYLQGVNINQLPKSLISVPVPETTAEQETVQTAYGRYVVLAQTGDTMGGTLPQGLGHVLDSTGTEEVIAINDPDFNGFLETSSTGGYLFTNWEAIPGGMSRIKIDIDPATGDLSVDDSDAMMIDFGTYGTIANCFGSMSPWGTPLTAEEWGNFGDSTHDWNNPGASSGSRDMLARYTDYEATSAADADPFPNTYRYHYIAEITDPAGTPTPVKHYTMGRFEHENPIVMPDQKTAYLSQDDSPGVFFKFVADTAGDLSAGTLYAAKLTQDVGSEPATTGFDITWVELAHGDNATIETWIAEYDDVNLSDYVAGQSSYLSDADAAAWAAGAPNFPAVGEGGGQVTAGAAMDDRVAFLESRKAAKAKGATVEWRKFEGIYINQARAEAAVEGTGPMAGQVEAAYVYFAIADMDSGMIDGAGDIRLSNRVKDCGGVYRMKLEDGYDVSRIEPVVMGATMRTGVSSSLKCDVDSLAQPDNVIVMNDGRIIIGEDGDQTNNTLWLYNPENP